MKIWSTSWGASTRRRSSGSEIRKIFNTSSSALPEIRTKSLTFVLGSWNYRGLHLIMSADTCYSCCFLHSSDVAMFFQPSVSCIVKSVLEQRTNAHKPIVVRCLLTLWLFHDKLVPSMLCSLAVSQLAIGYTTMSRLSWPPGVWILYVLITMCKMSYLHSALDSHFFLQQQSRIWRSHFFLPWPLCEDSRLESHLRQLLSHSIRAQSSWSSTKNQEYLHFCIR